MKTSNLDVLYYLFILLLVANTAIADDDQGSQGKPKKNMRQVITAACENAPYGPKCMGNLDAHRNYQKAYRDRGWCDDGGYCWRYGFSDGWSEDWRH